MKCFIYALRGVASAVRRERNMRIHLCFAFYVVAAGFITRLDAASWAAVLVCIGLVTALELVNTAIESACDAVSRKKNENIRRAKDCAAGAVLSAAVFSAAVGCAVFFSSGRPALALAFAKEHMIAAGIIVLALPLWIIFIIKTGRSHK